MQLNDFVNALFTGSTSLRFSIMEAGNTIPTNQPPDSESLAGLVPCRLACCEFSLTKPVWFKV